MTKQLTHWLSGILIAATLLAGCVPPTGPAVATEETHLKMGLLPILDVIPFFVAERKGYFAEQGITVELVPVKSAQERDTLMQTGQLDGQLNDLVSTVLFNKDQPRIKVVYTARQAYPEAPMIRILAAPGSTLRKPADLKGVPIGISQNTLIEYVTYRLLEAEGLQPSDIVVTEVSAIPVRFELLMNGQLQAATLPDPLAQGAIAGGAHLIVDDASHTEVSQSVLSFRVEILQQKPSTVRKFLIAWEKAVKEINANPAAYRDLLIEQGRVPESIQGTYAMPPFPVGQVPTEAQFQDVVQWLRGKGLISREIPYQELVDTSFLPTQQQ
ncbi:MAG: ABC transporter substrate-binding protein [Anaerolineae bacterium]|nr:ABC transporter substrate-binding protein [Anaerolineae bacterium]MDW8098868.1 ABC transporter substrate-binding protein [Anaerolineae bacterium]